MKIENTHLCEYPYILFYRFLTEMSSQLVILEIIDIPSFSNDVRLIILDYMYFREVTQITHNKILYYLRLGLGLQENELCFQITVYNEVSSNILSSFGVHCEEKAIQEYNTLKYNINNIPGLEWDSHQLFEWSEDVRINNCKETRAGSDIYYHFYKFRAKEQCTVMIELSEIKDRSCYILKIYYIGTNDIYSTRIGDRIKTNYDWTGGVTFVGFLSGESARRHFLVHYQCDDKITPYLKKSVEHRQHVIITESPLVRTTTNKLRILDMIDISKFTNDLRNIILQYMYFDETTKIATNSHFLWISLHPSLSDDQICLQITVSEDNSENSQRVISSFGTDYEEKAMKEYKNLANGLSGQSYHKGEEIQIHSSDTYTNNYRLYAFCPHDQSTIMIQLENKVHPWRCELRLFKVMRISTEIVNNCRRTDLRWQSGLLHKNPKAVRVDILTKHMSKYCRMASSYGEDWEKYKHPDLMRDTQITIDDTVWRALSTALKN